MPVPMRGRMQAASALDRDGARCHIFPRRSTVAFQRSLDHRTMMLQTHDVESTARSRALLVEREIAPALELGWRSLGPAGRPARSPWARTRSNDRTAGRWPPSLGRWHYRRKQVFPGRTADPTIFCVVRGSGGRSADGAKWRVRASPCTDHTGRAAAHRAWAAESPAGDDGQ